MISLLIAASIIPAGMSGLAQTIVVIAALIAIVVVACQGMGVPVPAWVWRILGIILVAVVALWAIRFVDGL